MQADGRSFPAQSRPQCPWRDCGSARRDPRHHLRAELAARLPVVNAVFLDTITSAGEGGPEWWTTPHEYLRSFLIAHLVDAERIQDAVTVATDFRWVSTRLHHHGPTAPIRDLSLVPP
ncbi:hypothetical protein [Streptomyces sp. RB110-2]|uniref:hypothetical protein n=1 Tax=Streptomyces sp. RB110-2 TaxID=2794863 RepID=UPI0035AC07AB